MSKNREDKIVLECARVQREKGRGRFDLPGGLPVDWERVFWLAEQNRVLPLVYRCLSDCCQDVIPEDLLARMKERCLGICTSNLALVSLLHELLALFADNDISVLAIKGPVFTGSVYGDIGRRSYGDLDILVPLDDLRAAIELLQMRGFRKDIALDQRQYEKLVSSGHHATLWRDGAVVELHWELTGRYCFRRVEYGDVSARAVNVLVGGRSVSTLGGDDLLLYLCVHGSRHYWLQLDAVCCVHELLVGSPDIDWSAVWQRAEQWGATRMLLLGLLLAQRLFEAEVPERLSRRCTHAESVRLDRVADWCIGNMFSDDAQRREDPGYWDYVRYHRALMVRKRDWLSLCVKPLFEPTHSDWQWLGLPAKWSILYYLLRPIRLAQKYTQRFFRRS